MQKIYMFLLFFLFFIFFNSYAEVKKDLLQKRNKAASAIDELKMALSPEQKKISSLLRDKIDQIKILKNTKSLEEIRNRINDKTIDLDTQERLRIDIIFNKTISKSELDNVITYLEDIGCVKINKYWPENIDWRPEVICYAPYDHLKEISSLKIVSSIQPVIGPVVNSGSKLTEGDSQLKADLARSTNNVSGAGIRVGVVSDGIDSRSQSISTGDLPYDIINVVNEGGDEGTAMMEIIYDLAPQCSFSFASAGSSSNEMSNRIAQLIGQDGGYCRIIVDDIGWPGDPYFTDGKLAQDIANWVQYYDLIYISAAGNHAESMYTAEYDEYDDGNIKWHDFYYANNSSNIQNMFSLENNQKVEIDLQWADNWEEPQADFDVYLYEYLGSNSLGDGGKDVQGSSTDNPPREILTFTNTSGVARDYVIQIKMNHLSPNTSLPKLKLLALNRTTGMGSIKLQYTHAYNQPVKNQIFGHPAAEGVISVAAYDALDTNNVEYYSSRGPTYLDNTTDPVVERKTPVITATDNVLITGAGNFGYQDENGDWRFPGTSAAAPHIAGIAALYKEKYPGASHQEFYNDLTSNALDIMGENGGTWNEVSGFGKADAYETLGGGPLKVTVDQQNTAGNSIDSVGHWESAWLEYAAGSTFRWEEGEIHKLKADTSVLENEKFHDWQGNNYINYDDFTIQKGTTEIVAYFDSVKTATVATELISSGFGGKIFFTDPWLRDTTITPYGKRNRGLEAIPHEYDSPLNLILDSKYQGVFLDQGYENGVWNPPYYSVKADAQQTFKAHEQDITGYFLGWEGTDVSFRTPNLDTTAVAFHANGAEARAVYKGHLASSVARATGYNNGRRIFKDNNNTLYLVYEDTGNIWFTSSTDGGKTWSKEIRLDSNTKTSLYPSISGTLDMLFVTWFDQTDLNIKLRRFNINTSQWYNPHTVASVNFGDAIKPAPAIAVSEVVGNEYNVYIAFHREKMSDNFQPTGIHEIVCYKNTDQNFDQWNVVLGPFNGSNPSLSHSKTGNNGDIGLVWDNNGKIYFKGTNYYGNWTATQQISDDLWYHQDNCKPNISYTSGIAHIVWEGFHAITEMPTGYYRYFKVDEERLSDLTVLPSHGADVRHLSVSSKQYADNTTAYNYTVVYEGDGIIKVSQTSDNFEEENFGEGKYPNITEHDMSRSVWTKYNDAPYLLKTDYVESSGGGISPIIINPTPVIDYVISANQNNSVEGAITLEVEAVKFNHDTVYFDNALKSKTMSVTQDYVPLEMDLQVRFHNVYNGFNDDDVLYSLVFDDSTQGEIFLTNLKYKELPTPTGGDFEKFFKVTTIVNLAGKTGKICLKTNGLTPSLVTKRLDVFSQSTLSKSRPVTAVIPENFALHQNFPNPFNPLTHISVELPQEAKVELSVYTINGKKVQTLLKGQQAAGIYEVVFDGSHLASGVYIYRLTTDKGFVQSKKMMLIR